MSDVIKCFLFLNCVLILLMILLKTEKEVGDDDKYIAEMFYTLQEVVDQLKKGTLPKGDQNDSSRQSPSKSRDK